MRLLDAVMQAGPSPGSTQPLTALPSASEFSGFIGKCPLRLVLADDLVIAATTLAYAECDRLAACLDLVHVPAETMWVEWTELPRQRALRNIVGVEARPGPQIRRTGAFIRSDRRGRIGNLRSFWSTADDAPLTAALVTQFDWDRPIRPELSINQFFQGHYAGSTCAQEPALDEVLAHIRYRLDPRWVTHFSRNSVAPTERPGVLKAILGSTAFDLPMLCALFLLMAAKDGVRQEPAQLNRVNRERTRTGKPSLLEHIEVRLPVRDNRFYTCSGEHQHRPHTTRLHHVRGHLVRRGQTVFWRVPHLRGSALYGVVRTRTITLTFS